MIYEDILHFENKKMAERLTEQDIVGKARRIAIRILQDQLEITPKTKNTVLLINAISNSFKVRESEVVHG